MRTKNQHTIEMLDAAMMHLKSVSYKVSLRWAFYRLLDQGIVSSKKDYNKFKNATIKARKSFEGEWCPDSFVDDTRLIDYQAEGYSDIIDWADSFEFCIDKYTDQDYITIVLFEAKAMHRQFQYYTSGVTLVPFGGDASINLKWKIAKHIQNLSFRYNKPIIVLYFGDCDKKGQQIPLSAYKDIKKWCDVDFKFEICGLNLDQAKKYNLPMDFEGKQSYQWESLSDEQANEIITSSLSKYQNMNTLQNTLNKEKLTTDQIKAVLLNGV